jgi:tetratricopeptide (TPR) repeat protein
MGETPHLFLVLSLFWIFYLARAEHDTARELAQQLLTTAQSRQNADFLLRAHAALGASLFYMGEFVPARTHLEHASSLYEPTRPLSLAGLDAGELSLVHAALSLWSLSYPDQAVDTIERALALARELSHPFSLAHASMFAAGVHLNRGEGEAALRFAEASVRLATEEGFATLLATGELLSRRARCPLQPDRT